MATFDQRVNLPRSSNGKSASVASMRVVSSMDTRSTQSKVSSGRLSSTSMVRARMIGSKVRRFSAPVTGLTNAAPLVVLGPVHRDKHRQREGVLGVADGDGRFRGIDLVRGIDFHDVLRSASPTSTGQRNSGQ